MADSKVSYRYASSLLENVIEKDNLDTISKDMEFIASVLNESRELRNALESPVIKPETKSSILKEIFKTRVNNDTMNFLLFVVDKNREELLNDIVQKFLELRDEHLGIVNVNVKSAFYLDEEQKDQLKNKLEDILKKKVRFKLETDREVVGGFIAKVKDTVYDASLKHQLEILKKQFLQGGASLN